MRLFRLNDAAASAIPTNNQDATKLSFANPFIIICVVTISSLGKKKQRLFQALQSNTQFLETVALVFSILKYVYSMIILSYS